MKYTLIIAAFCLGVSACTDRDRCETCDINDRKGVPTGTTYQFCGTPKKRQSSKDSLEVAVGKYAVNCGMDD